MTSTREQFSLRLLGALGVPATREATAFLIAWGSKEGMRNPRYNNPWATTQRGFGGVPIPGQVAGVKMYPTPEQGIAATVQVIAHGSYSSRYLPVFSSLKAGSLDGAAAALQASGWCGGPNAPCPNYGAGILATTRQMLADQAQYRRRADEVVGGDFGTPAGSSVSIQTAGIDLPSPTDPLGPLLPGVDDLIDLNPFDGDGIDVNPLDDVGDAIDQTAAVLNGAARAVGWVLNPENWRRVGMMTLGAALTIVGVVIVFRDIGLSATPVGRALAIANTIAPTKEA